MNFLKKTAHLQPDNSKQILLKQRHLNKPPTSCLSHRCRRHTGLHGDHFTCAGHFNFTVTWDEMKTDVLQRRETPVRPGRICRVLLRLLSGCLSSSTHVVLEQGPEIICDHLRSCSSGSRCVCVERDRDTLDRRQPAALFTTRTLH